MYRQGDVLLKQVKTIPKDAKVTETENGRLILARGESTGHSHTVCAIDGTLFIADDRLYLRTDDGCELVHQEHAPIHIDTGNYEVIIQREYSPQEIRRVQD
jgi:hypothetical protein